MLDGSANEIKVGHPWTEHQVGLKGGNVDMVVWSLFDHLWHGLARREILLESTILDRMQRSVNSDDVERPQEGVARDCGIVKG